ncbi:MAG: PAS domain-containing protein [Synechococcales bacterium]|nr:PAS domain-containing protein [Synechococcales bacterium]
MILDRFQLLLEHSSDAIAEFDASLRYVSANSAEAFPLGYHPRDLVGKSHAELLKALSEAHPLRSALEMMDACLRQVIEQAQSLTVTYELVTSYGIKRYETVYTPVLSEQQTVSRVFSIGRQRWAEYDNIRTGNGRSDPSSRRIPVRAILNAEMPGSEAGFPELGVPELGVPELGVPEMGVPEMGVPEMEGTAPRPAVFHSSPGSGSTAALSHPVRVPERSPSQFNHVQAAELRQSADFLRLVIDSIPQYIFWKDRHSVYLGCNRRWAEMAGLGNPDEVIGLTDDDLPWTQAQRDWYVTCDRQVMDTNTPMFRIRQSQRQADGRITWRETSKLPIHDGAGQVIGLLGMIEDVTERKLVEDLLRRSEAKYRHLAQREELLNQLATQIRESLNLNILLQTVVQEVRRLLDTDRVVVYRFDENWQGSVVFEDVIPPWISTLGEMGADNCFPDKFADLYSQGRVRAIADITQAGLDECHTQFLLSLQVKANLIVPILIHDHLWGLLVAHECRAPREWKQSETDLLYHLAGHIGIGIQQAELYAQATQNACVAQAQAKKLEQALHNLQDTQAQLIQTEKMSSLGQLVAGIAHEINNPVNFIYGNIGYIAEYVQDLTGLIELYRQHYPHPVAEIQAKIAQLDLEFLLEDVTKILKSLRVGSERIRQLVLSLRNFSRVDEADMKRVDIHDGIDSTLLILGNHFKAQPHHDSIHVVKEYGPIPPVECYPGQLNQVLMNILSNAIDALSDASHQANSAAQGQADVLEAQPTITIITELSSDQKSVIIRICDNGPGIPRDVQARLFDPFFTTKPVGKGTGLGLSISQKIIVEKHQGSLTCISAPGQGAEFRIEIPLFDYSPT